ncbi:MAG: undecaprenyldiphospho-muramoylpentapeptide beta-N-acetylglucosaminyltransferase [Gammaproteobacteria bacterium]|nr:undecaprenyldiphospho-muramoylpentapeptide beta-N-acetylglucosaminyltransferase [Gammaproteobacteria bacterium]
MSEQRTVLIMAGGTGGHIFPAISIAEKLQELGMHVEWLGSSAGLELQILGKTRIPLHLISARGLRGKGLRSLFAAPFMILQATGQALRVIKQVDPDCVLGMGGFVTGPGGVAARLRGKKLLVHEQNAVPGVTNKILARMAFKVLQAFPGTFPARENVETVGNPVRQTISRLSAGRNFQGDRPLHILVLGGSQGAQAINQVVPLALAEWSGEAVKHQVMHQTGRGKLGETVTGYSQAGHRDSDDLNITEFIDDMAQAYEWADIVVCRSGASTVAELAAAGMPAILVPYPYHRDQQQLKNARWLEGAGAAQIIEQQDLTAETLRQKLIELAKDRQRLSAMSKAARSIAIVDADSRISLICQEAANV